MQTKYRAGIIGCGRVAWMLDEDSLRRTIMTHAKAYSVFPFTQLCAASDTNQKRLEDFGGRWSITHLYTDSVKMLKDEHLDIVSICTHSDTHYAIVKSILSYGKSVKAIFCEKPIARTLLEARSMVSMCRRKGVVLGINHPRRWDMHYRTLKQVLSNDGIGRIHEATFYYSGGLANIGTHAFDLLRFLFGEAKGVWIDPYSIERGRMDIGASGLIYFKRDINCSFIHCRGVNYLMFELDILGAQGRAKSLLNGESLMLYKAGPSLKYSGYRELNCMPKRIKVAKRQRMLDALSDIVACIKTGSRPQCDGQDGYRSLEIVAACYESIKTKQWTWLPLKTQAQVIFSR